MKTLFSCLGMAALLVSSTSVNGQTVASEDFDGGALNLISSSVPTQDGGGGDTFAVGATAAWPTTGGTPFALTDNSVGDVGDSTFFSGDTEGVYGVNSDFNNNFIGISDSDEFGDVVATWDFDISSTTDALFFSIDAGSMESNDTFAYSTDTVLRFEASIDGGATQTVFDIIADASGDGYNYRALDDGVVIVANENALLATGDNAVTKLLAETGLAAGDQFLDKSLAADGTLDTFQTALNGNGNTLTITFTSNVPFEGAAFDNLRVFTVAAVPEPSSALLGVLALGGLFVRRKRS